MKEGRMVGASVVKVAESIWNYSLDKWGLEFSDESRENLVRADKLLEKNSLVFYINHTNNKKGPRFSRFADIILPAAMVLAHLPNAKQRIAPVAESHYSLRRDPVNALGLRLIGVVGAIDLLPVVQPSRLDAKASEYKQSDRESKTRRVTDEMKRIVAEPGAVFGIAPEATRTDGSLKQGARGLGLLSRFDPEERLRYSDLAIAMGEFHDEQPRVVFGEPLALSEVLVKMNVKGELIKESNDRFQFITDVHMRRLAQDLPRSMRGYYGEEEND